MTDILSIPPPNGIECGAAFVQPTSSHTAQSNTHFALSEANLRISLYGSALDFQYDMSDQYFTAHYGTYSQDHTPISAASAVSSFNKPASVDSSLRTPVSQDGGSPPHGMKRGPFWYGSNENTMPRQQSTEAVRYYNNDPNGMKWKESAPTQTITPEDLYSQFPPFESPLEPPDPYWGSFGVSHGLADQDVVKTSWTTQPLPRSVGPSIVSQAPILSSPDPATLRVSKRSYGDDESIGVISPRQTILAPKRSISHDQHLQLYKNTYDRPASLISDSVSAYQSPRSYALQERPHRTEHPSATSKRRKLPTSSSLEVDSRFLGPQMTEGDLEEHERLLISLRDETPKKRNWEQVVQEWNARFNPDAENDKDPQWKKKDALSMRYKRLKERLRPWTVDDIVALNKAKPYLEPDKKWENVAKAMEEHFDAKKWTWQQCRKKWMEMHPQDAENEDVRSEPKESPISDSYPIKVDHSEISRTWHLPGGEDNNAVLPSTNFTHTATPQHESDMVSYGGSHGLPSDYTRTMALEMHQADEWSDMSRFAASRPRLASSGETHQVEEHYQAQRQRTHIKLEEQQRQQMRTLEDANRNAWTR